MEIKELFEALAGYLDFVIDLVLLNGMEKYARIGKISPTLVSYCVIGIFIAYLMSMAAKVPNYESESTDAADHSLKDEPTTQSSKTVDQMEMAQFLLLSIIGAFLLHGFLLLYSLIFGGIGNVQDTLNGVFAYNAVYHPFNAIAKQAQRVLNFLANASRVAALISAIFLFIIAALYFVLSIPALYAIAAVHAKSIRFMVLPFVVFVILVFALLGLYLRALGAPMSAIFQTNRSSKASEETEAPQINAEPGS